MNVIPLNIPPRRRAANKLALWQSSPLFVAVIDALLDIHPRRTSPAASDVVISSNGHVVVVSDDSDAEHVGTLDELENNLKGIADAAELDAEERAALFQAIEEAKVDAPF